MVSYAKNREPVAGKVRTNVGPRPLYSALGPEKQRRMIGTQRFNLWICSRTLDAGKGGFGWDVLGTWVHNNPQIISQQPVLISVTYITNLHLIAERFSNLVTRVRQYGFIANLFEMGFPCIHQYAVS